MPRPRKSAARQSSERVRKLLVENNGGPLGMSTLSSESESSVVISINDSSNDDVDEVEKETSLRESRGKRKRKNSKAVRFMNTPVHGTSEGILESDSDIECGYESRESDDSAEFKANKKKGKYNSKKQKNVKQLKVEGKSDAGAKGRGKSQWKNDGKVGDLNWEIWEKDLENWGPWRDDGDIDVDALVLKKNLLDAREPPADLLMSLLPFQKEWLGWSLNQEESLIKGGILADEMGMGKTIQAISLILSSRALRESNGSHARDSLNSPVSAVQGPLSKLELVSSAPSNRELPQVKATLVVCPLVAVIQWRNEIARFTKEGSVKVLVYHGAKRCKDLSELAEYDIVLTTYSIVELEHRVHVMPAKERCKWCERLFYPDKLAVHLLYFCGPTAQKSEKQAKQVKKKSSRTSKIMSAAAVTKTVKDVELSLGNSKTKIKSSNRTFAKHEVESKVMLDAQSPSPEVKLGARRGRRTKIESEALGSAIEEAMESIQEEAAGQSNTGFSLLHIVKWDRVILDEAHSIKDRRCSTSKAVFALKSNYKWALSGTPLQNRVGELYSLVRFLEIEPFSYYYCRVCDCKSLDYSFGKEWRKCDHCEHSPLQHFCWWNKFIANPIKKWGYVNEGRKAMILLKYKLLDSTLLRRTKMECAADLTLPPRITLLRRDAFDTREEDFYQALYTQSQSQFNTYISAGTLLNNYAHIFDLLTRLRQAVNHPYLVVYSTTAASFACQSAFDASSVEELCGVCKDPAEDSVTTSCKHTFCKACVKDYVLAAGQSSTGQAPPCPTCQKPLTVDLTGFSSVNGQKDVTSRVNGYKRSSILNRINVTEFQTSTKIDALREEVMLMLQKDATAKAIVFSQFTSFLDLIGFALEKSRVKCVKLNGSMSIMAREQMIERFTNDAECKVFLMSLKAGGVALNLTVASHVFLMDPWWNPAVEQQAQDRIHRLGQYKPMRVVRFVIENTIEERILRLQEKKQLVFEGTVGGSAEALGRLTEDDMRFLFTS